MQSERQTMRTWPRATLYGLAAAAGYAVFTLFAILRFPQPVSHWTIYLSQLGNAEISPHGAVFYLLAMLLAGLFEIPFFFALSARYSTCGPTRLLRIGLLAGVTNGLAVVMSGVFAEHVHVGLHLAWSYLIFLTFIPLLLAYNLALWRTPGASRWLSRYGFVVCAVDAVLLAVVLSSGLGAGLGSLMEWAAVWTYLVWMVWVALLARS
jgi:hypothetical protein